MRAVIGHASIDLLSSAPDDFVWLQVVGTDVRTDVIDGEASLEKKKKKKKKGKKELSKANLQYEGGCARKRTHLTHPRQSPGLPPHPKS